MLRLQQSRHVYKIPFYFGPTKPLAIKTLLISFYSGFQALGIREWNMDVLFVVEHCTGILIKSVGQDSYYFFVFVLHYFAFMNWVQRVDLSARELPWVLLEGLR